MTTGTKDFECCPPFDPLPWEDKMLTWENKLFVKANVFTCFYMPINFGSVMKRLNEFVEKASAQSDDYMCLSDHTSRWNMDLYLAVNKELPGFENAKLSGTFYSRVYEGDYNQTGKWCADFEAKAKERNLKIKKMYMWYTTCPKCAKKYGKNYTVIIAKI